MVCSAGIALSVRENRWEREMEYRSAFWVRLKLQMAEMGLNNRAANPKAESHAVAFCRHERLENALSHLRANSRPAVGNREFDQVGCRSVVVTHSLRRSIPAIASRALRIKLIRT